MNDIFCKIAIILQSAKKTGGKASGRWRALPGGQRPARGVAVAGASSRVACGGRRGWGCGKRAAGEGCNRGVADGGRRPDHDVAVAGASSRVACGGRRAWGCGYGDCGNAEKGRQVKAATGMWHTEGGGPTMMSRSQVHHPALHAEGDGHGDADTGDGGYAGTGWQVKALDGVRQAEGCGDGDADTGDGGDVDTGRQVKAADGVRQTGCGRRRAAADIKGNGYRGAGERGVPSGRPACV